jgi:hypothetical protein
MSTNRSAGPGVPTQGTRRYAATRKKDRSPNLCAFTFADGRQCRTPRCSGHLHLCYFHAQKEAQSLAAQQVGEDISRFLPTKLLTACDLGAAMSRLFCAVAQGQIKPKVASTLAYLAQTMLQSIPIAQHEYIESFDTNTWRSAVRVSFRQEDEANTSAPQSEIPTLSGPAPKPPASSASAPTAKPPSSPTPPPQVNCHSEPARPGGRSDERPTSGASPESYREEPLSSSNSSLATHHSPLPQPPQPAPSPHTPLPGTSTEFAQQVMAGRSEISPPPGPGRETGSSSSSPGPAPSSDSARAQTSCAQPAASSPCTRPTHNNSLPTPTPPTPHPVPPSFGAPANWHALIPPKPRRRFSRHWRLE